MIRTLFPLDLSRYSAAVQKSWMTDDPNNGSNGNQLKRRRSPTSLLFPAAENLSNEPGAIVLSCANVAFRTSESCKRVEAQKKGRAREAFGAE
jgi:hypothetical protein